MYRIEQEDPKYILDLIKQYNLKVHPCLIRKKQGYNDYWYAGVMEILSDYVNGVKSGNGVFAETLEDAVLKAVEQVNNG